MENATATSIDWWGCNGGPNATGCADATLTSGGTLDATSWLELGIEGLPGSAEVGAPVAVEAVLRETLSNGVALSLPPSPVVFAATPAAITSPHDTDAGIAEATYTPAAAGIAQISATLDATTVQAQLLVTQGGIVTVSSIGQTSSTPNAADNDFTRINDMLQAVDDDVTVRLLGTFDWTEPFANASWQLGSDGLPGTGDEYGILPPSGFQNVTLDAATLGGAIIQGPGDLPGVNLEAFLAMWGGSYKDWTFARLDIRGFDLGIGMFCCDGADVVNQFDGVAAARQPDRAAGGLERRSRRRSTPTRTSPSTSPSATTRRSRATRSSSRARASATPATRSRPTGATRAVSPCRATPAAARRGKGC